MIDKIIAAARHYIKLGYPVIPIIQKEVPGELTRSGKPLKVKQPMPGRTIGPAHPITDGDLFAHIVHRAIAEDGPFPIPADCVGIAICTTGAITVLDDDTGGDILEAMADAGLLDDNAPGVFTRRGVHEYYQANHGGHGMAPAGYQIDVKAFNGYVLAPPTVLTIDGKEYPYEFREGETLPPADQLPRLKWELPVTVAERRDKSQDRQSTSDLDRSMAEEAIRQELKNMGGIIPEGQRNHAVLKLAMLGGDYGLDGVDLLDVMVRIVEPALSGGSDPFSRDEFIATVEHASEYRQDPVGRQSIDQIGFEDIPERPKGALSAEAAAFLNFRTAAEAAREPAPKWLIDGLVERRSPCSIVAPSGQSKTNVALSMAQHLARGLDFGPYRIDRPYNVAYVDLEGGAGTRQRIRHLENYFGSPTPDNFKYTDTKAHFSAPPHIDFMLEYIEAFDIDIVFVDTYADTIVGIDENDNSEIAKVVLRQLERIVYDKGGPDCAVVFIGHSAKNSDTEYLRGASAVSNRMFTRLRVKQTSKPGMPLTVVLNVCHVKNAYSRGDLPLANDAKVDGELALMPMLSTFEEIADAQLSEQTKMLTDIYGHYISNGRNPLSVEQTAKLLRKETGQGMTALRNAVRALIGQEIDGRIMSLVKTGTREKIDFLPAPEIPDDVSDLIG